MTISKHLISDFKTLIDCNSRIIRLQIFIMIYSIGVLGIKDLIL